ncbi:TonB-system energizer ExbB [Hahella sp. CCB-MM4]|uniref:TonB-system energizer ExbB n=1 Tax=Hahella sp. (strain CCB-MM4) TaxID=1926491 RepID=UPI000BDAAB3D|nr:TonB-system energizer ExbB [Hahella sp. CCB-MM4]OZG73159.1 TonB-system energizer ExbB [Hahella sp. CCB-MM4]
MESLSLWLDVAVFSILGSMSFIVVWLGVERVLFLKRLPVANYSSYDNLTVDLSRNITTLYSIGANAPYVGLLGTVAGILLTFYDMGQKGQVDVSAVMSGLALALKATALGLVVAIPTIILVNGLNRKIEVKQAMWRAHQQQATGK